MVVIAHPFTTANYQYSNIEFNVLSKRPRPLEQGQNEAVRDEMLLKVRLENTGDRDLFYLASANTIVPVCYDNTRIKGEQKWSHYEAYSRKDAFTGIAYQWLMLPPGVAIEFDVLDKTNSIVERSISIFVNTLPLHEGRSVFISEEYRPVFDID